MIRIILPLLFLSLTCACLNTSLEPQHLIGDWTVDSWIINETGATIPQRMDMSYDDHERYILTYDGEQEQGKYWIMGDYLHTIADGEIEKKVKIISLSTDTLQIQMNRAGRLESVLLLRVD